MPKLDVARARLEHRTPDDFSALSIAGDRFGAPVSRVTTSTRCKTTRPAFSVVTTDELASERGDATRRDGAASQKKLAETHSNIHVVNQTNALLRERLAGKSQPATLTRENLMMLEDNLEHNRPAEQLRRKREFIQKEMEKSRQKAGSAEAKAMLLKKINDREERQKAAKETRADSVLEDLRKARFRMVAQMAQKRLQSITPDIKNQEEDLSNRIDWYLRFCGEEGEEGDGSRPPSRTPTEDHL